MKPLLFLIAGLVAGAIGGSLFVGSLPPDTPAEFRAEELEGKLKRAENRITELENLDDIRERMPRDTGRERSREIMRKIRDGEPVSVDDFFRAFQPALRDTAPIFNRLRVLEQTERFDSLLGMYSREYDLTEGEQRVLRDWFEQKARENNWKFDAVIHDDNATVFDLIGAMEGSEDFEDGIEQPMSQILDGDEYREFSDERLADKAERVQREADAKLARLETIVDDLREEQKDDLFVAFARSSEHYDPKMAIEGIGASSVYVEPGGSPYDAVYSVLDDGQAQTLRGEADRRRNEENKKLRAVGLKLPETWDPLELTGAHSF